MAMAKPRPIAVAVCATLLALQLTGGCDCFAPPRTAVRPGSMVAMAPMRGDDDVGGGADRALACLPYLIPLMDGDRYGRFLFYYFPVLGLVDQLALGPFKLIYGSIPFGQLLAFLGLSVLSRNPDLPRPLRFNMQQALILDIALIFPSLLGGLPFAVPAVVANSGSNFVFLALVGSVGYALASNLTGKVPDKIPIVSDAARSSIGY